MHAQATSWMTRRYALALTVIAALASAAFASFEMVIVQQESTGAVVNISGRQRMLSQRTALFVKRMIHAETRENYAFFASRLRQATDLLEISHEGLTQGSRELGLPSDMSQKVRQMYFQGPTPLDKEMRDYIVALKTVAATPFGELEPNDSNVRHIMEIGPGRLLDSLDVMVWQYQKEGEEAIDNLHRLEAAVLTLTLFTLSLEVLLIFRPMVRQAEAQIEHISHISEQLMQARDNLEEQVRQRTAELMEAKEAAEQANVAKTRFLAAAGHDLSQPLEAIGMFTGMLDRMVDGERAHALMQDLKAAQRSMRTLLQSLLEISKLEVGAVQPRPRPVELGPIITQIGNEFLPLAMHRGLTLRVVPTQSTIVTDPALLERILRNLMSNAVRYTRKGGILMGCRHKPGALRIEVHDTGVGIPEAERQRIFDEFSQLDDPDRDRGEGIGLGLAISDRLAKLLCHPLEVRSQVGRGSVFSITVPLAA